MSKKVIDEIKDTTSEVKGISFHSIIDEYQRIAWELENGEVTDEIEERLLANEKDAEKKLLGMFYVIQLNTAKIEGFYKVESEKINAKIKRLNKANGILKDNCMLIASTYGKNDKYTSLQLNCTKVTKEVLNIDDEKHDIRVMEIRDIINGLRENDTTEDEFNCYSTDFTLKNLDIEDTIKVRKLLLEHFPNKEVVFNPNLDKVKALELVKAYSTEDNPQKSIFDGLSTNDKPKVLGLKGVSKGYTYFPRFS